MPRAHRYFLRGHVWGLIGYPSKEINKNKGLAVFYEI